MAVELSAAYVTIIPSLKGAAKQISAELSGVDTSSVGSKLGSQLSSSMGKSLDLKSVGTKLQNVGGALSTSVTKPATIAGAALAAITVGPGLKRLTDIDTAQAKLKGLGLSAEGVQSVMESALASVKGTAYGLGDAATVAAGLAAAGVQQGDAMTGILSTVADVAAASGRSLTDVGTIFNSVAARGKLQGDDMLQLMSSGVPVLQLLGTHLGKTSGEISDMVSKGQIDFQTFADAMQEGLGGSALAAGDTFTGAFNNLKAALGRVGADLLSGIFPAMKDGFAGLTKAMDDFGPTAKSLGEAIGPVFAGIVDAIVNVVKWFTQLPAPILTGIITFVAIAAAAGPFLIMLGKLATGLGAVMTILPKIVGAFQLVGTAFKALSAAFLANPIGIIIALIAALVAGLIWFFTQTEVGQQVWAAFTSALQSAWQGVVNFFATAGQAIVSGFQASIDWIVSAWNGTVAWFQGIPGRIAGFFSAVGDWIATPFRNAGSWAQSTFQGVVDWFRNVPGWIGGFFAGIGSTISAPFRAAFNWIRSAWNSTVGGFGFTVPDWIPGVGGKSFKIPRLAEGATIKPRNGGTLALLAEAGRAETVVDTGKMNALMDMVLAGQSAAGGSKQEMTFNIESNDPAAVAAEVAERLRR